MTASGSPTERRPNIVFVLTDDHAAHAIGCYGSVVNTTPRLDELASDGARLDNCFVTNSLCTPSRASILTGTYSHVNGVYSLFTPMDAGQPTFLSELRAAGYRTAMIGKWHLGHGPGHDPDNVDHWEVLPGQGDYWNPTFLSADGSRQIEGYATDLITDLATEWVEGLDGDEPWCVLVWHKAPHRPWEPKPEHRALFDEPRPIPTTFWDDYSTRTASIRRTAMRVADHLSLEDLKEAPPTGLTYEDEAMWKYQRYMRDYLACVHSVDENVGRLTDWLAARDELDDTLMVYSSDQGFFLGDHGWFDKRLMFEESLRMPFLVRYPGAVPAGQVVDGIVTNVDIAQTLLDAAGIEPHPRMQGRSFWGGLTAGTDGDSREAIGHDGLYYRYWENDDVIHKAPAHYGYRTDRYKLIYYYNDGLGLPFTSFFSYPPEWELYDLIADPDEVENLADDAAYAEIRDELAAAMWQEQARLGDAPHPSQPVPPGCEDVVVAAQPELPTRRWLDPGPMNG